MNLKLQLITLATLKDLFIDYNPDMEYQHMRIKHVQMNWFREVEF